MTGTVQPEVVAWAWQVDGSWWAAAYGPMGDEALATTQPVYDSHQPWVGPDNLVVHHPPDTLHHTVVGVTGHARHGAVAKGDTRAEALDLALGYLETIVP